MAHARRRSSPAASVNSPSGAFHGASHVTAALRGVCTAAGAGVSSPLLCAAGSNAFASLSAFPSLGSPYSPAAGCSSSGGCGRRPLVLRARPPRQEFSEAVETGESKVLKDLLPPCPSNENSAGAAAPQPALTSLVTQISKLPSPLLVPEEGVGCPLAAQTSGRRGRCCAAVGSGSVLLSAAEPVALPAPAERVRAPRKSLPAAGEAAAKAQQQHPTKVAANALPPQPALRISAPSTASPAAAGAAFCRGGGGRSSRKQPRVPKSPKRAAQLAAAENAAAAAEGAAAQERAELQTQAGCAGPAPSAAAATAGLVGGPSLRAKRARRPTPLAAHSSPPPPAPLIPESLKKRKGLAHAPGGAAAVQGGAAANAGACVPEDFWERSFELLEDSCDAASPSAAATADERRTPPRSSAQQQRGRGRQEKTAAQQQQPQQPQTGKAGGGGSLARGSSLHEESVLTALFPLEWLGRNGRVSRKHGFLRGWEGALRSENLLSLDEGVFVLLAPSLLTRCASGTGSGAGAAVLGETCVPQTLLVPRQRIVLRRSSPCAEPAASCVCNCSASTASTATRSSSAGSPSSCSSEKAFCGGCALGVSPARAAQDHAKGQSSASSRHSAALPARPPLVLEKPAFLLLWRYSERPCPQDRCMRWFSITTRFQPVKWFGRAFESHHGVALVGRLKALLCDRLGDVCPRTQAVVRAWGLAGCLEAALAELGVDEVRHGPFKGFPEPTLGDDDLIEDTLLRRITEDLDCADTPHPRWQAPMPAQKSEKLSTARSFQRMSHQSGEGAARQQLLLGDWHEARGGRTQQPFALVTQ